MNVLEIATIRADFARILERADDFAARFYDRLFEIGPELRQHFPEDLPPLQGKLLAALGFMIDSLDSMDTVVEAIKTGEIQIEGIDFNPHHYVLVGEALLDTVERELGDLTDSARQAWVNVYTLLADQVVEVQRQTLMPLSAAELAPG